MIGNRIKNAWRALTTGSARGFVISNRGQTELIKQYREVAKWRAQFNPLRGLTITRAISLLEEGQRGQYADLQWLYSFIERREPTLRGLLKRRLAALGKLDWNIKCVADEDLPAGCTAAQAEAQRDYLRSIYDGVDNLREAIDHLALAEFRGFSHLEKHFNEAGEVSHLEAVDQWFFNRDGLYGPWLYNAEAASTNSGTPIDTDGWVIREERWPINEIALICYLRKNLSQKDWDAFVETYGVPPIFLIMPANVPSDKEAAYQEIAEQIMADARGALPNGSDVKTVESGSRGNNPFRDHLQYQDEQLVLAGTSGQLTMLSQPTGIGGSQGDNHQEAFEELAIAEAMMISEVFQKQIDEPALRAKFPGERILAYWELAAKEETNVGDICAQAATLAQAGYAVEAAELSEKTGYNLQRHQRDAGLQYGDEGLEGLQGHEGRDEFAQSDQGLRGPTAYPPGRRGAAFPQPRDVASHYRNRNDGLDTTTPLRMAAREQIGKAVAADLQPLRKRLAAILAIEDPEIQNTRLKALLAELPGLLRDINADPESAKAFEGLLGSGMLNGMAVASRTDDSEGGK